MPEKKERIPEQRLQKLANIRALGVNPYPSSYKRTHTTSQAVELLVQAEKNGKTEADEVIVAGRVTANRLMGKVTFIDIRDDSGKIQLFISKNEIDEQSTALLKELDIGDIVGAKGVVFRTRSNEPTIRVKELTLLSKSLQPLPEKWHGLSDVELRYRQRYLDLISNEEVKKIFRLRSQIISAVRRFLDERGFIEVETPVLHGEAGGALATPFITHHNALDHDFVLRIALELHLKRLIVGGFDRVYEIGRIFRNEGISTEHSPEFTMLESYEAYADYRVVMEMVEQMVSQVSQQVMGTMEIKYGDDIINLKPPWKRISLRDAIKEYSGIDFVHAPNVELLRSKMKEKGLEVDPQKNWAKLVDELLKTTVRPNMIQPAFIYDYPVSMSPLAKNKAGEERVVERFQPYAAGLELGNAYSELNDPILQKERFEQQMRERMGDDTEKWMIDDDFIIALEHGMPPTGGLGIGIDRLVMLLTNSKSIREVILFPQLKEKQE